ncbi:hypothetical protein quinque_005253 [Culex quinquefasciatus]|uniref:Uncharacterized protein n=1 Tax=Culex pipiens pipiens TaxID=38569 RepID=A0ABD1D3G4_CULPP
MKLAAPLLILTLLSLCDRIRADSNDESLLDPMEFSYVNLWKYAESECEKKGINGSIITRTWINVRACLRNTLDVIQFNMDAIRLDADNQRTILAKHCPNLRKAPNCFEPFMVAVKGCVPEKNYEIFEALRGWIESVLGHVCKDDGAHIVYDRVKHEKCTNELGGYIFECAALNIINKQYDDRKALTEEDCGSLVRAKDCLLNKLSECSVFAAATQLFYDNFIRITSCIGSA